MYYMNKYQIASYTETIPKFGISTVNRKYWTSHFQQVLERARC
jgi:hypothetical protein